MRIPTEHLTAPRVFAVALGLLLFVAAWLLFAPERLGGGATYVIVHGSSMEPRLHADDLVIVRQASSARVGDVAAYRSHDLGQPVLHRVVSVADGRYVFKGDHNGWLDREHPTSRDLIGKRWLTVPQGGGVLEWTRAPAHAPLLTVPAAALFVGGFGKRRKRRSSAPAGRRPQLDLDPALVFGPVGQGLLLGAALVGALSLFLGLVAFARPTAVAGTQSVAYKQQGRFGYSADSREGFVYDNGGARTGQPVFLRLSRSVAFAFTYRLRTGRPSFVSGRAGLSVQLKDTNGWKRTIVLAPARRFRGDHMTLRGRLDLDRVRALIHDVETATGVLRAGYQLAVTPHVQVWGSIAGRKFHDRFAPALPFQLDELQLAPLPPAATGADGTNPLHPSRSGRVDLPRTEPRAIGLLGRRLEVRSARQLAIFGGLLSLFGAAALVFLAFRGRKVEEIARIRARYGWSLISVAASATGDGRAGVRVDSMRALIRLAERREQAVLHEDRDGVHSFFFEESGIVYWFRPGAGDGDEPPLAAARVAPAPVKAKASGNGRGSGTGRRSNGKVQRLGSSKRRQQ